MASEKPRGTTIDRVLPGSPTEPADLAIQQPAPSVWRTDWQWVALAWLGGGLIGGIFLAMAFTLEWGPEAVTRGLGGLFLIFAPGCYVTWQTWKGHRKSAGKG